MKQLHVVGSYPVGTHTFVLWQLAGLRKLGYQSAVLAANTGNDPGYQMANELGLDNEVAIYANYRTSSPWRPDPRRFTPAISRAANRRLYGYVMAERRKSFFCKLVSMPAIRDVDIVQVHFTSWAIEVGLPLAKLIDRPCVVTAHGTVADAPIDFLRYVQKNADAIVVVSDNERQTWIERTGSDAKLHRVWNGLPIEAMSPHVDRALGAPLILVSIGRLSPEKRIGDLIEVVAKLRTQGHNCTLSIFGEGPLRSELESCIRLASLESHVRLYGNVPHTDLMAHLATADILVHPCENEPFGLAMIEGMSASLPVVAARSNGAQEIVVHEKTGYLYAPGDIDVLMDYLIRLASNPGLRHTLGEAGRRRVEQEFSIDAHIRNMDRIWRAALNRRPSLSTAHSNPTGRTRT